MKLTLEEIEDIIKEFLWENYKLELKIPISINGRLTSVMGRFTWKKYKGFTVDGRVGEPVDIQISKKYLQYGSKDDIVDTIKHEAVHYALFVKGLPHSDGDKHFEEELKRLGVTATETSSYKFPRNVRVYTCKCEGDNEHIFLRTITPSYCTACGKNLIYKEKRKELC